MTHYSLEPSQDRAEVAAQATVDDLFFEIDYMLLNTPPAPAGYRIERFESKTSAGVKVPFSVKQVSPEWSENGSIAEINVHNVNSTPVDHAHWRFYSVDDRIELTKEPSKYDIAMYAKATLGLDSQGKNVRILEQLDEIRRAERETGVSIANEAEAQYLLELLRTGVPVQQPERDHNKLARRRGLPRILNVIQRRVK